ncbi:CDD1 (YLR245C) [Zygosaccharomyces parabailii]|nr:CDD1 (YLR245C) [Zygosaccharomyces parabailii]CDH09512.1 related to Cytidine deaminase [Zygosaccharomyces bailii ISA1307]
MVDLKYPTNDLLHNLSSQQLNQLKKKAVEAKNHSYSPYSKFRVGCCILTKDNQFVDGANVENASYGGAICAERTAAVKAVTNGQQEWLAIAISGDRIDDCTSPCGICRQFIREFASLDMPVIMLNSDGSQAVLKSFGDLLPMSFGPGSF